MDKSNDSKFQELIRLLDATLSDVNTEGSENGNNALSIVRFLSNFPGMSMYISEGFQKCISNEFRKSKNKANVKDNVNEILLYSNDEPDSEISPIPNEVIQNINDEIGKIKFRIQFVGQKIIAHSSSNIIQMIYHKCKDYISKECIVNDVESYLVLVSEKDIINVEQEYNELSIKNFCKKFSEIITLKVKTIQSSFQKQLSCASDILTVEIESPSIDNFIEQFNVRFNKDVEMQKHCTFAVKMRSLW
jgi:hypothetical protein